MQIKLKNNEYGQSLLEITISLGLAMIIVTALTLTTINGLKNSQLSQNQLQATKLAQEGLEKVREARDKNCEFTISTKKYNWYGPDDVEKIWSITTSAVKLKINTSACTLTESSTDITDGKFTRVITMSNDAKNATFTSIVTWNDFSGPHNSTVTTVLSNI